MPHFANIDSVFIAALKYDDVLQANRLLDPDLKESLLPHLNNWMAEIIFPFKIRKPI